MAKKKLYFQLSAMNVGGVEKSFLSYIDTLSQNEYEIHLGLLNPTGGFMDSIPSGIYIHNIDFYTKYHKIINDPPKKYIKDYFLSGQYKETLIYVFLYLHFKLTKSQKLLYKYLLRNEKPISIEFDEAYAYASPATAVDYYVCNKVNAKKKIGWIHFDITKFGIDKGMTRQLYKNYDSINIVSQEAKEKFDKVFPEFKDKTKVVPNVVSERQIKVLAENGKTFTDTEFKGKRILTVGRISKEKGQDLAVRAAAELIQKGFDIKWYFVGDGNFKDECIRLASELGVSDRVNFLGLDKNPYAYMRDCDIYVQPSQHEGFCITLAEAKIFNKPIVSTSFAGAKEQLENYSPKHSICDHNAESMAETIISFFY